MLNSIREYFKLDLLQLSASQIPEAFSLDLQRQPLQFQASIVDAQAIGQKMPPQSFWLYCLHGIPAGSLAQLHLVSTIDIAQCRTIDACLVP